MTTLNTTATILTANSVLVFQIVKIVVWTMNNIIL